MAGPLPLLFRRRNAFTPASLPGAAIVWPFDAGVGSTVTNAKVAGTRPVNLLLGAEHAFAIATNYDDWTKGGCTATDGAAAGRSGGANVASRLQFASGNAYAGQLLSAPAGPYTVAAWVKSNTGSDQTVRLGIQGAGDGLAVSGNLSVPAASGWVRVSYTRTVAAGSLSGVYLLNDGATATDLLVDGIDCFAGGADLGHPGESFDLRLRQSASSPPWVSGGVGFTANGQWAEAVSGSSVSCSEITLAFLAQQSAQAGYGALLNLAGLDSGLWLLGGYANSNTLNFSFGGQQLAASLADLLGAAHVVVATVKAGVMSLYVDGTKVATTPFTGTVPVNLNRLVVGCLNTVNPFPGTVYYGYVGTAGVSDAQAAQLTTYLRGVATAKGVTANGGTAIISLFGDSFTASTDAWKAAMRDAVSPVLCDSLAVSGAGMTGTNGYGDQRAAALAKYALGGYARSVAVLWFGQNDLNAATDQSATMLSRVAAAYTQLKADGFRRVVVVTLPCRNVGANQSVYDIARAAYNAAIIAGAGTYCDAYASVGTAPHMGANGSYTANPSYYTADGSHPSATGQAEIAAIITPVAQAALA